MCMKLFWNKDIIWYQGKKITLLDANAYFSKICILFSPKKLDTSVGSTSYQRFLITFNDSYLWVLVLSLNFQVEGTIPAAGSSDIGMEKSRYCFLRLSIAITITSGIVLSRDRMYSLSSHLEEMCLPWENLKLVVLQTTKICNTCSFVLRWQLPEWKTIFLGP